MVINTTNMEKARRGVMTVAVGLALTGCSEASADDDSPKAEIQQVAAVVETADEVKQRCRLGEQFAIRNKTSVEKLAELLNLKNVLMNGSSKHKTALSVRKDVARTTALVGLGDGLAAGAYQYTSGALEGGLVGSIGLAVLCPIAILGAGWLIGDKCLRALKDQAKSVVEKALPATGMVAFSVVVFALLFHFAEFRGSIGESQTFMKLAIMLLGITVYIFTVLKWSKAPAENSEYKKLLAEIDALNVERKNDYEFTCEQISQRVHESHVDIDELGAEAKSGIEDARDSLNYCDRAHVHFQGELVNCKTFWENEINAYRGQVCLTIPKNLVIPQYFKQPADLSSEFTVKYPLNLLVNQVGTLETQYLNLQKGAVSLHKKLEKLEARALKILRQVYAKPIPQQNKPTNPVALTYHTEPAE